MSEGLETTSAVVPPSAPRRLRRTQTAAAGTVLSGGAGQAALIVSGVLGARMLGVENRGHLALFIVLPLVFYGLGSLGLPVAVTYFVARAPSQGRAILRSITRLSFLLLTASMAAHALVVALVVRHEAGPVRLAGFLSLAIVPALWAQYFGQAILQGERRFQAFNVLRLLPGLLYSAGVLALFVADTGNLPRVMLAWVAASLAAGGLTLGVALRRVPEPEAEPVEANPSPSELVRFGLKGLLGSTSPVEGFQLDQILVGLMLSPASLGLYAVAAAFLMLPRLVAQSVGMVAYPEVAARRDPAGARRALWRFLILGLVLCIPTILVLEVAVGWLIPLLFGSEFSGATPIARILLVAAGFLAARRILAESARGAGFPLPGTAAEVASWVALVPAVAIFAPLWGAEGVALAMVVSSAFGVVALAFALLRGEAMADRWTAHRRRERTGPPLHRRAAGGAAFMAAPLLLGLLVARVGSDVSLSVQPLLPLATIAVAAYPIIKRAVAGTFDLFEPVVLGCVMLIALFGARPIAMLVTGEDTIYGFAIGPDLTSVFAMGLLGTAAFVVGYEVATAASRHGQAEQLPSPPPGLNQEILRAYLILLGLLGGFLFAFYAQAQGSLIDTLKLLAQGRTRGLEQTFANSSEYFSAAPILFACGAILLVLAGAHRFNFGRLLTVLALIAFPLLIFFLLGGRRFIIPTILVPIIVYYLSTARRPSARQLVMLVPIAFLILATIPIARSAGGRAERGGFMNTFEQALREPVQPLRLFITGEDTAMVAALAVEKQSLEETGHYALGRATVGDLVLAPIPHLLFPGKPQTARDQLLTDAFGGPCAPVSGGCHDFSAVGTFYQDFWYPGIILGMGLTGVASARIWRRYKRSPKDPFAILLAATWTVFLPIIIRAGALPAFSWFLYFFVPSYFGLRLALAKRSPAKVERIRTMPAGSRAR